MAMRIRSFVAALAASVTVLAVAAQEGGQQRGQQSQAPLPKELVATEIPCVIAAGEKVQLIRDGFNGQEGPVPMPGGGILFTETGANRIVRIGPDDSVST